MKKLTLLILIAVLVLGLIASVVVARGPANRATGSIWLDIVGDDWNRYMEFDAHAGKDLRPAKGTICWYQWLGAQELLEITSPRHELEVKYVNVDGDTAWFAAGPESQWPARIGWWLVVQVHDGGAPATGGDEVDLKWVSDESAASTMVEGKVPLASSYISIGGNLVVHYYED